MWGGSDGVDHVAREVLQIGAPSLPAPSWPAGHGSQEVFEGL